MRWRHSLVYLVILSTLVGYYYFETIQRERHDKAEQASKKVFSFSSDMVNGIEVKRKEVQPIYLSKDGEHWRIIQPVQTDADQNTVKDLLNGLKSLEKMRNIVAEAKDFSIFGLDPPRAVLRFKTDGQWHAIYLGEKTPVGDGYYARTAEGKGVFIISQADYSRVNKGLNDLRRRDLFSFEDKDIVSFQVEWSKGNAFVVERAKEHDKWILRNRPEIRLKKIKVENVLDQIRWLRAISFLEEGVTNKDKYDLLPPRVSIRLTTNSGKKLTLDIGAARKNGKELVVLSSELPSIVTVNADLLADIPKSFRDLEDRSLLTFDSDAVQRVIWKVGDAHGEVIRSDNDEWKWRTPDGKEQGLKESWRVRSLFWELEDAEYSRKMTPPESVPENPHARIDFYDAHQLLGSLYWNDPGNKSDQFVPSWLRQGKVNLNVEVAAKTLKEIEKKIKHIVPKGKNKAEK